MAASLDASDAVLLPPLLNSPHPSRVPALGVEGAASIDARTGGRGRPSTLGTRPGTSPRAGKLTTREELLDTVFSFAANSMPSWPAADVLLEMTMATTLSPEDAAQLRTYERDRHDALAEGYIGFFAPVTALAIAPCSRRCGWRPA